MRIDEKPFDNKFFSPVLILAALAGVVGLYLILTTVVISEDGVGFIRFAQELRADFAAAIKSNFQHPGFSFIIEKTQLIFAKAGVNEFWSWIYSGQCVALFFRLAAIIAVYHICRLLTDSLTSFTAALIFLFLPDGAQIGANVLSDWPHLAFVAAGMFFVLKWCDKPLVIWAALAGLSAGLGYLVRPESIQIIIYGVFIFLVCLFSRYRNGQKWKVCVSVLLISACFLIFALPYMIAKGGIFPKKAIDLQFAWSPAMPLATVEGMNVLRKILFAGWELLERLSQFMVYFFLPFWMIGLWVGLADKNRNMLYRIVIGSAVVLNIVIMLWLYTRHGYIGRRHLLPLAAFTMWCVPIGITWVTEKFVRPSDVAAKKWFVIIVVIGIVICAPKTFRPIGYKKQICLQAGAWINANTPSDSIVFSKDARVGFYGGRQSVTLLKHAKGSNVYMVSKSNSSLPKTYRSEKIAVIDAKDEQSVLNIYKISSIGSK